MTIVGASGMVGAGVLRECLSDERVTSDLVLAAARALAAVCPSLPFCYVSGMGTDSSEGERVMWARVKGAT